MTKMMREARSLLWRPEVTQSTAAAVDAQGNVDFYDRLPALVALVVPHDLAAMGVLRA